MDPRGHVYEDFEPPNRVVREPPTYTISVDLSAARFKKDHIKVQLVHSQRRLIVHGERHVAGNRWSRFRLQFKLPDECDTKGIQARFDKGVLRVIIPGLKCQGYAFLHNRKKMATAVLGVVLVLISIYVRYSLAP